MVIARSVATAALCGALVAGGAGIAGATPGVPTPPKPRPAASHAPAPKAPAPKAPAPKAPAPSAAPDPLTGFICTVISAIPGGVGTVTSVLQTVGTAEKQLVTTARQMAPGPADAYSAWRAPIDAQITTILTTCASHP